MYFSLDATRTRIRERIILSSNCWQAAARYLPVKSPWLNPIEPTWVHSKRAIIEPARLLSAQKVAEQACGYLGWSHKAHLSLPDKKR